MSDDDPLAEGHRILILLKSLSASNPSATRKIAYKSARIVVRRALR